MALETLSRDEDFTAAVYCLSVSCRRPLIDAEELQGGSIGSKKSSQ